MVEGCSDQQEYREMDEEQRVGRAAEVVQHPHFPSFHVQATASQQQSRNQSNGDARTEIHQKRQAASRGN
jgi:hypothetical protein